MKVCLIGSEGNMGKRYSTILNYLEIPFLKYDIALNNHSIHYPVADKYIICTPTHTHSSIIGNIIDDYNFSEEIDVLCEKPITKHVDVLEKLKPTLQKKHINLYMVNQYQYLIPDQIESIGLSIYSYFKTGQDTLLWDCIQIIGLANSKPIIKNTSPVWLCQINGIRLELSDMDWAYIEMIRDFLGTKLKLWDINKAIEITKKVIQYENEVC